MIYLLVVSALMLIFSFSIVWNYLPEDKMTWLLDARADYIAIPLAFIGCCGLSLIGFYG